MAARAFDPYPTGVKIKRQVSRATCRLAAARKHAMNSSSDILHQHGFRSSRRGFTLVEALVVVVIITLLLTLLLPALHVAKESARRSVCMANLRQLAVGSHLYADDFDENYPYNTVGDPYFGFGWRASSRLLMQERYVDHGIYNCPSIPLTPPMGSFPIDEYYGDAFDEQAQIAGWSIGKSVRGSYEFHFYVPDPVEISNPYLPVRRRTQSAGTNLAWDIGAGIVYHGLADSRFFPMVSHGAEGGHVVYVDVHVAWKPAELWVPPIGYEPGDAE